MLYDLPARNTQQRFAGIAVVIGFHILFIMGFLSALGRHMALPLPVAVATIFTEHQAPPEPEPPAPPKPDLIKPDAPELPIPEVAVAPQASPSPLVASAQSSAVSLPAASAQIACPNSDSVRKAALYPAMARREGIQGDVLARFVVGTDGQVRNITIVQSANRVLNPAVVAAVREFHCVAQATDVAVDVPFTFHLN